MGSSKKRNPLKSWFLEDYVIKKYVFVEHTGLEPATF